MDFIKKIRLPDIFTGINALSGMLAIFYSLQQELFTAFVFFIVSIIADGLDGKIARLFDKVNDFGKQFDSLADIVSFGVAPIFFTYHLLDQSLIVLISYGVFLICGMLRLARYNVTSLPYWEGLPITYNGLLIGTLYLLGVPLLYFPYIYLILGLLMLSKFRVRSPFK